MVNEENTTHDLDPIYNVEKKMIVRLVIVPAGYHMIENVARRHCTEGRCVAKVTTHPCALIGEQK